MPASQRIVSLQTKHATLDREIVEENQRPLPDDTRIHELKREKLRIKDEITEMVSDAH
jgi:hypothetical protein